MAVNKVVINDEVVLDLTGDTVQAADLPKGVIAHSATGAKFRKYADMRRAAL